MFYLQTIMGSRCSKEDRSFPAGKLFMRASLAFDVIYCQSVDCSLSSFWEKPPMWLGIDSRTRHNMWVDFFSGSLLSSERFFSGYSGFPLPSKPNISKFLFDPDFSGQIATLWSCHCKFLFYSILFDRRSTGWVWLKGKYWAEFEKYIQK